MGQWTKALGYAAVATLVTAWLAPGSEDWGELAGRTATLLPVMRAALLLEGNSGCALSRIWR
jgi:hypothetical protein